MADYTGKMTDEDLLALVNAEHDNSIGFDLDAELNEQRERALEYFNGEMRDVPSLPNRSKAMSLDVADGIETLLPDVVEVLTSGDDMVAFRPVGPEDEEAAQQETDVVKHVIFNDNPGWLIITTAAKDALQAKTGVFKWFWEEGGDKVEEFEGKSALEVQSAFDDQSAEVFDVEIDEDESAEAGEERYKFKMRRKYDGCVKVETVAPEDITVARDTTIDLQSATYVATRSRPRVQDLIAQGIDETLLERLPAYTLNTDSVSEARDTVDEGENQARGDIKKSMRQVEVIEHYIRLKDGEEEKLLLILTGGKGNTSVVLRKQEVNRIQLAAITPYLVPHRFYGQSVADKLVEPQRIRTALTRALLDSSYFALNQRMIVNERSMSPNTIPDLLRNEPGVPIRANGTDAVVPVSAGGLNFDPLSHLEYFATEAEKRTGIVRNAQGLNPDTLHDTAKGAQMLMVNSQKRVRLIIRTFAETGIKDLYLGVHALLREHSTQEKTIRLRNKWVAVSPASWSPRNDMTIEVGRGASDADFELAMIDRVIAMQAQAVQAGLTTLVKPKNLYNSAIRATEKAGFKNAEAYWSNPDEAEPQAPQPDPKLLEMQMKGQIEAQKLQMQAQSDQQRAAMEVEKAKAQLELDRERMMAQLDLEREKAAQEAALAQQRMQMEYEQKAAELALKREELAAEAALRAVESRRNADRADYEAEANLSSGVRPGGEPG